MTKNFEVTSDNTIGFDFGSIHIELIDDVETNKNKLHFIVFFVDENQKYYNCDSFDTFQGAYQWYENQYNTVVAKNI